MNVPAKFEVLSFTVLEIIANEVLGGGCKPQSWEEEAVGGRGCSKERW